MYRFGFRVAAFIALTLSAGTAQAQQPAGGACRDDAVRLCSGIKPGGGRIISCLEGKRAEVSPACAEMLDRAQRRHTERFGAPPGNSVTNAPTAPGTPAPGPAQ